MNTKNTNIPISGNFLPATLSDLLRIFTGMVELLERKIRPGNRQTLDERMATRYLLEKAREYRDAIRRQDGGREQDYHPAPWYEEQWQNVIRLAETIKKGK